MANLFTGKILANDYTEYIARYEAEAEAFREKLRNL